MTQAPAPFIVGVARSGTTLLRLMLDAHSTLAIPPETNFAAAYPAFERGGAGAAVGAMVEARLGRLRHSGGGFARWVQGRRPASASDVVRAFFELYAERRGKPRWGNKTSYFLARMTLVQERVPEARFVHIVRDGRDVALSVVPLWPPTWRPSRASPATRCASSATHSPSERMRVGSPICSARARQASISPAASGSVQTRS